MTIILPYDYHAQKALENNRVICISEKEAQKQDIRALRIGILNIMPEIQTYEFNLLHPLGKSVLQVIPVWIKLKQHTYKSSNKNHLEKLYQTYEQATQHQHLDGMIVTGAPIETLEFQKVNYWDEIKDILTDSRQTIANTLGICWGALALANILGLKKENYSQKIFGIFETYNLNHNHRITGGLDDVFWMPQSRFAGISNEDMEIARDQGLINLLAVSPETGYSIFEAFDHKYTMITGHLEYNAGRLVQEVIRDKNRSDVLPPKNFDINNPYNRWRGQRNEFFAQWIKYCYEETVY